MVRLVGLGAMESGVVPVGVPDCAEGLGEKGMNGEAGGGRCDIGAVGGGSEVRSWSFGDVGKGEGRVSSAGVMRHATVCKTARPVRLLRTRSAEKVPYSRLLVLSWASLQGGLSTVDVKDAISRNRVMITWSAHAIRRQRSDVTKSSDKVFSHDRRMALASKDYR